MRNFLRWLFERVKKHPQVADERLVDLERQVQTLRLDLEERERLIASLRDDLERLRRMQESRLEEALQVAMERLLTEAAAPTAQLLTQAHLVEKEGKPVRERDILAVARRLVRVLQDQGLVVESRIGEEAAFDPDRHELLGSDEAAVPGQKVVVRMPGVSYRGRILRRAGVEKVKE